MNSIFSSVLTIVFSIYIVIDTVYQTLVLGSSLASDSLSDIWLYSSSTVNDRFEVAVNSFFRNAILFFTFLISSASFQYITQTIWLEFTTKNVSATIMIVSMILISLVGLVFLKFSFILYLFYFWSVFLALIIQILAKYSCTTDFWGENDIIIMRTLPLVEPGSNADYASTEWSYYRIILPIEDKLTW